MSLNSPVFLLLRGQFPNFISKERSPWIGTQHPFHPFPVQRLGDENMFQSAVSTRGNLASYNQVHTGKLWKAERGESGVSAILAVLIISTVLQVSDFSVPYSSVWSRDGGRGDRRRSVGSVFCRHRPAGMAGAGANREGWGVLQPTALRCLSGAAAS